ncbi:metal-dependent hydrolase [Natronorubrum sp. FCH18a]|uniref:metal-dependent hydrolase n=1 Tax=Natronorubrum sp. FCH18a TaxID=3447018 RepID=UPI003F50DB44
MSSMAFPANCRHMNEPVRFELRYVRNYFTRSISFLSSMWPLGHAAIGYLLYRLTTRVRFDRPPGYRSVLVLMFGTQFPDLVDKPLAWILGVIPSGSGPGHSLVVLGALVIGFGCCTSWHGNREYVAAFGIGALAHALTDAVEVLWNPYTTTGSLFWPISSPSTPTVMGALFEPLSELYFIAEFALVGIVLGWWYRDGCPGLERIRTALRQAQATPK